MEGDTKDKMVQMQNCISPICLSPTRHY